MRRHGEIGLSGDEKGRLGLAAASTYIAAGFTYEISLTWCPVVGAIVCMAGEEGSAIAASSSVDRGGAQQAIWESAEESRREGTEAANSRVRVKVFALR